MKRYGYRIKNGRAYVEPSEAARIVSFFTLYAEGAGIKDAARSAGITLSTGACRNMLSNRLYLGTDYYPQLVDEDLFNAVQEEKEKRGAHLTGIAGAKKKAREPVKTRFKMVRFKYSASTASTASTASQVVVVDTGTEEVDPAEQARVLYSQIVTVDPEPERAAPKTQNCKGAWKGIVPYGFEKDKRGKLRIHDSEAEVVRRIFKELASGKSMHTVAEELNDDGITTKRGKQWLEGTLRRIVWNSLYKQLVDPGLFEEAGKKVRERFRGSRAAAPSVPHIQVPAVEGIVLPTVDNHKDIQEPSDTVENWISYHPEDLMVFHTEQEDMTIREPSSFPHNMLYHGYSQLGESSEPVEQYGSGAEEAAGQYNCTAGEAGRAAGQYNCTAGETEEETHALYGKQCPFVRGHFLCPLFDPCPDCPALPVREPELVERSVLEHQMDWYSGGLEKPVSLSLSGTSPPGNGPAPSGTVDSHAVSDRSLSDTGLDTGPCPQSDDGTTSTEDTLHGGKQVVKIISAGIGYSGAPSHLRVTGRMNDRASKLKRVAAYARVSTDSEEQESSYEAQVDHYTKYINDSILHPDWTFAGIYADEGISGTSTRNRDEFNRMISDCEEGKVDLVLVKSISRLARNTVDSLNTIRKLKDLGIGIIFEKEGINTLDAAGEVLITILSSLAQQESESISQNVRMGLQYRMQEGKGSLNTNRFLGYQKRPDSKYDYEIVASEAEIVRRIYREFLDGYSPAIIARHLETAGILSPAGKRKWYGETVRSILTNEKYCGDMLLQKYFVENCLTHKLVRNTGQMPQYFVEDHHDPVVPKAVFFQVQGEMERRSSGAVKQSAEAQMVRCNEDLPFTGRVFCGNCNRAMRRFKRRSRSGSSGASTPVENESNGDFHNGIAGKAGNNAAATVENCSPAPVDNCSTGDVHTGETGTVNSGGMVAVWRCYDRETQRNSKCGGRVVKESELEAAVVTALNKVLMYRDDLLREQAGIWKGELKRIDALVAVNRERSMELEERLISLTALPDVADDAEAHSGDDAGAGEIEEAEQMLGQLTEQRNALLLERAEWANREFRIRILLELADEMMARRQRAWEKGKDARDAGTSDASENRMEWTQGEQSVEDPACRDYDAFFRRTKMMFPGNVLNQEGDIVGFDKSLVIRYVDRVLVQEDGFEVRMRAGISIKV